MVNDSINRRQFLAGAGKLAAGALVVPWIIPARALGRDGSVAPSNRVTVAQIGCGVMGWNDLNSFLSCPDAQLIAVCDPKTDKRLTAKACIDEKNGNTDCAMYNDFRELLARPDLDAVSISTNDHWHVLIAIAAARAGKDMYVEKPLGVCIEELKVLRDAIHRYGRVFQFGAQQRSMAQFPKACELALNGRIGKVHTIRVSAPAGMRGERIGEPTFKPEPVPEGFDYDLWLGPAPVAPYHPKRVVNPYWFHISDYSAGYIAGWGIHHVDIAQWGNGTDMTGPVEVEGTGTYPPADAMCDNPLTWDVTLKFGNGVTMLFTSDGGPNQHGIKFEGTEGWIHVDRGTITAEPAWVLQEVIGPEEIHLIHSKLQQQNLIDCIKTRARTVSPIDTSVRSDALCHLGNIAMKLGRKLRWDPEKEDFINDPEATRLLNRPRRGIWQL